MTRRDLLHVDKLADFTAWLSERGIPWREGRGYFQVIQVQVELPFSKRMAWHCVFKRLPRENAQHYTVAAPLVPLVLAFIRSNREAACRR